MFSMINLLLIFSLSLLGISSQLFAEETNPTDVSPEVKEKLDKSGEHISKPLVNDDDKNVNGS